MYAGVCAHVYVHMCALECTHVVYVSLSLCVGSGPRRKQSGLAETNSQRDICRGCPRPSLIRPLRSWLASGDPPMLGTEVILSVGSTAVSKSLQGPSFKSNAAFSEGVGIYGGEMEASVSP